jgi:hypothetical protein
MTKALTGLALPLAMATLSGCLTHVPAKGDSGSLGIRWRESYESARDEAGDLGRPMLLVMVAGELKDKC